MKTILVATDYSNAATNALNYAAALACEAEAKIVLYNAFKLPELAGSTLLSPTGISELMNENKLKLSFLASSISRQYGILVEPLVTYLMLPKKLIFW